MFSEYHLLNRQQVDDPHPFDGLHTLAENHFTIWNSTSLDTLFYSVGLYVWFNASTSLDHNAFFCIKV